MPRPIALCLEKRDGSLVRCTAKSGREAGLAIDPNGAILWMSPNPAACELWVSQDDRLMAFVPKGSPVLRLERKGRSLTLPEEKAVVLRDGDDLIMGDHRFRVYIHGYTRTVDPPRPLKRMLAAGSVAAALALAGCASDASSGTNEPPTATLDAGAGDTADSSPEDAATDTGEDAVDDSDLGFVDLDTSGPAIDSSGGDDIDVRNTPPK